MRLLLLQLALLATASLVFSKPVSELPNEHGKFTPFEKLKALPACATKADLRFQPDVSFDKDGSYNTAAIYSNGILNPGRSNCRRPYPHVLPEHLATSNVYARARCNGGWCAHVYAYYFVTDVGDSGRLCLYGHRHDWEHVVVWTRQISYDHKKGADGEDPEDSVEAVYVSVSNHGGYHVRSARDVPWRYRGDDPHPGVIYHKDGILTHAFRFAVERGAETPGSPGDDTGRDWHISPLVSWRGFRDEQGNDASVSHRNKLAAGDWGKANFGLRDGKFEKLLQKAKGGRHIPLNVTYDDETSPGEAHC